MVEELYQFMDKVNVKAVNIVNKLQEDIHDVTDSKELEMVFIWEVIRTCSDMIFEEILSEDMDEHKLEAIRLVRELARTAKAKKGVYDKNGN